MDKEDIRKAFLDLVGEILEGRREFGGHARRGPHRGDEGFMTVRDLGGFHDAEGRLFGVNVTLSAKEARRASRGRWPSVLFFPKDDPGTIIFDGNSYEVGRALQLAEKALAKYFDLEAATDAQQEAIDGLREKDAEHDAAIDGLREKMEGYIPLSEKGAPGGVATLGDDGKVPKEQLPDDLAYLTDGRLPEEMLPEDLENFDIRATVTQDGSEGDPSVTVTEDGGVYTFAFKNLKGPKGDDGKDGEDGQDGQDGDAGSDATVDWESLKGLLEGNESDFWTFLKELIEEHKTELNLETGGGGGGAPLDWDALRDLLEGHGQELWELLQPLLSEHAGDLKLLLDVTSGGSLDWDALKALLEANKEELWALVESLLTGHGWTSGGGGGGYELPEATTERLGGVRLGSDARQEEAAQAPSSEGGRTYPVQLDGGGKMVVNVPWVKGESSSGVPSDLQDLTVVEEGGNTTYDGTSAAKVDLTKYVTEDELSGKGYATESYVDGKVSAAGGDLQELTVKQEGGDTTYDGSAAVTVDLTAYAKKSDIPEGGGSVEIVDNLDTADSGKALSANQGKVLGDLIGYVGTVLDDIISGEAAGKGGGVVLPEV